MKRMWKQWKEKHQKKASLNSIEKKKIEEISKFSKGGGGCHKYQSKKKFYDKIKIQCFNCEKYGHFATNYWFGKGKQTKTSIKEANMVQDDSDSDLVMLIITTSKEAHTFDMWHLDSSCYNLMTGHKE